MVSRDEIEKLVNTRARNILRYAELLAPTGDKFQCYRGFVLDELGENGLIGELKRVLYREDWKGTGRNRLSEDGGAP